MEQKNLKRANEISARIRYLKQVLAADFSANKQTFYFKFEASDTFVPEEVVWSGGWKLSPLAISAAVGVIISDAIAELADLKDEAFAIGLKLED